MAQDDTKELWQQGESLLFKARLERRKQDVARRKAGRKFIKAEDVKLEWEPQNGIWIGGLVSQELGFDNRVIEVDCHIYPPHTHSVTHKHNEAIIIVLRGAGYSLLDNERIDWKAGDTLYVGQGVWHQHYVTSDEPAMVVAIKPLPIQEYLGELNIVYKGDKPEINRNYRPQSFAEEFGKGNLENKK
jgi:quercetin dioxygenase-like cupin family protein